MKIHHMWAVNMVKREEGDLEGKKDQAGHIFSHIQMQELEDGRSVGNTDSGHKAMALMSSGSCSSPRKPWARASQPHSQHRQGTYLQVPALTEELLILFWAVATGRFPGFSGCPHTPCTHRQQQLNLLGHKKEKVGKIWEELEEEMGVGGRCDHISLHTCMKLSKKELKIKNNYYHWQSGGGSTKTLRQVWASQWDSRGR